MTKGWHKVTDDSRFGEWESADQQWRAQREEVPEECAGPHPMRDGGYCEGEIVHYVWRWVLCERSDRSAGGWEMVGTYRTLADAKRDSG